MQNFQTSTKRSFLSDNAAGAHPQIIQAIIDANQGHAEAYGADEWTKKTNQDFKKHFGEHAETFPVFSGTGANVIALTAITQPIDAILCSDQAHIYLSESGAPEKSSGCKLVGVPSQHGKITPESVQKFLLKEKDIWKSNPSVLSFSQATEYGTIYTCEEIRALTQLSHDHGMVVHVDGARIANAAVALGVSLKKMITDTGVDILSFGGTKNGLLFGDAVVILNPKLVENFVFYRKQGLQLASKMRFISAQLSALLSNDLWKTLALHSNQMTAYLYAQLKGIKGITITQPVQTNSIFAIFPKKIIQPLKKEFPFNVWNAEKSEVRLMTAFDTQKDEIARFVKAIKGLL